MASRCRNRPLASTARTLLPPNSASSDDEVAKEPKASAIENTGAKSRRDALRQFAIASSGLVASAAIATSFPGSVPPAEARLEAVNRPDLLPSQPGLNIIQTEKILTSGQAKRMNDVLTALEKDTGFRFRVVCQNYPNTPGLAIREYWSLGKDDQKDDLYVVMIVDQFGGQSNVLNFNVGEGLRLNLPTTFLRRLQSKFGTTFYVRDNGLDQAVVNAIESIATCLRSEEQFCTDVPDAAPSMKSLGF